MDPLRQSSWNAYNSLPLAHHWPQLSHVLIPSCKGTMGNAVVFFNWACCYLNKSWVLFIKKQRGRNTGWQMGVSVIVVYAQRTICIVTSQVDHFSDMWM